MREMLSVLSGNEMVFGIILGNWLLLMAAGALLGRAAARLRRPLGVLLAVQVVTAVLPITAVFALRALWNVVFVSGAAVGVTETVAATFVLLAPYCLVAGFSLTLACTILATRSGPEGIAQVYFLDSIGEIVGGVLFSFVLVWWLDHFQMLYLSAMLNLALALCVARMLGRVVPAVAVALAAVGIALAAACGLEDVSAGMLYAGEAVAFKGNSPYGSVVVTGSPGQYNFIENGERLFSTHDVRRVQQTVHYAMAQRPQGEHVLLISGGVSGTAKEILEYPRARVDYVELDWLLVKVAERFSPGALADKRNRIRTITTDGRLHVRQAAGRYDVIIVDVPDPLTFRLNRFYTRQFFRQARRAMTGAGVLCITLERYKPYLGPQRSDMIAICHRTLRDVFGNVAVLPTDRLTFLASEGPLSDDAKDIADALKGAGIDKPLFSRKVLENSVLAEDRKQQVARAAETPGGESLGLNRDFAPVLYYYRLRFWLREFDFHFSVLEASLLLGLGVYLLRIRAVPFAVFSTGLAASTLQIVLLLGFQILYGSVYYKLGLIVTMFMLGLAAGSFVMNRTLGRWGRRGLAKLELALALYAAAVPAALVALGYVADPALSAAMAQTAVPVMTLVLATLVGMEFPLAGKVDFAGVAPTASRLYVADLLGAAIGALLVSTLLIPLIGVAGVCLAAGGLKLLGAGVVLRTARH